MPPLPSRFWQDLTTAEFARLDLARVIAVLPVGATEQHGPHLPVGVDTVLNTGILNRMLELLPDDAPVAVLPAIPVGLSPEHADFPGTLTLSPETLRRMLVELGESVARAGIRKLALFNSHGGQPQILDLAAQELRTRLGMLVVKVNSFRLPGAQGLFSESELRHGIHAGAVETAAMMHLRPDLVRYEALRNFVPSSVALEHDYVYLRPHGPVSFAWQSQDLHPSGACGDATLADPELGRKLIDALARSFVQVLLELDRIPIDTLKDRP